MKEKKEKKDFIILEDVTRYYRMGNSIIKAVDGISIKIKPGEFAAIMGPSGSGKSTMMNLVGSLDMPTKGSIYLDGYNISHFGESDLAQVRGKKMGFIFQQFNLIPNLTAKENVILPMIFQKMDGLEREKKAEELLKLVELENRVKHYPANFLVVSNKGLQLHVHWLMILMLFLLMSQ